MNTYDKKTYEQDFPEHGYFNWKIVKLKTPEMPYYDGHKIIGVVLHDGNFMTNGVLFLKNQYKIIDEDPLKNKNTMIKEEVKTKLEQAKSDLSIANTFLEIYEQEVKDTKEKIAKLEAIINKPDRWQDGFKRPSHDVFSFEATIKDTVEDELADTIMRILDICGARGIDIEKHIELKMKYNATRERMHGKNY